MALDGIITERSLVDASSPARNQVYSALSTGANVLVTANSGKQIQVIGIALSTGTSGVYTLRSGSDTIAVFNLSANSPVVERADGLDSVLFSGSSGEDLNIQVTGAASNAGIYIQYRLR